MPQNPYLKVRWLPASDIAELWRREATTGNSKESIEAELRRFLYMKAIGHDWRSHGLIPEEEMPPLEDLPPASTAVRKSELKEFFQKQLTWPLPRFWFPEEALEARGRGRPSDKSETVKQFGNAISLLTLSCAHRYFRGHNHLK